MNVELDSIRALAQGQLKGTQGILGRLPGGAAMPDDQRRPNQRPHHPVLGSGSDEWRQ